MGILSQVLEAIHKNCVPFCDEAYDNLDENHDQEQNEDHKS